MHLLAVDQRPRGQALAAVQGGAHHRQVAKRDLGAKLEHVAVEQCDQPVPGPHPIARRDEHLGDPSRERGVHPCALQVEHRLRLLGRRLCQLRLDLLPAAVVLPDCEPALLDREHLALLVAAHLVQARLRTHLAFGEVPGPSHLASGEHEKLLLVFQGGEIVPVPQHLVLQIGLEARHLGIALGEHEPDLAIVEGEQPIVEEHLLPFEHVHRFHVRRHRRGQVRDARGVDQGEEHELGRHHPRFDCRDRHRPGRLLGTERLAFGLALDQRRHAADAGGDNQQR